MRRAAVLVMGILAGTAGRAGAQQGHQEAYLAGDYATGAWNGLRPALRDGGVDLGLVYTADLGRTSVAPGADAAALSYLALFDGWIDLDSQRLGLWRGGRLFVGVQHAHGYGRAGRLESFQTASNIDTPALTQLGECFLEQRFAEGRLWLRLGKQDSNRDFGLPRYPGNFVNDAYGDLPTIPMPSHPTPAVGAMVGVGLLPSLRLLAGGFEGRPEYGGFGFATAVERARGYFTIAALEYLGVESREGEGAAAARPTTRHTLGVWYHSADQRRAASDSDAPLPGNQGIFVSLDQRLYNAEAGGGGMHLFGRTAVTWAAVGQAFAYAGGGLAYHGWGPRVDDTVGLGLSTVWLEQAPGSRTEMMVEAFYKARFTRFVSLQPDVQIFRQPQGRAGYGWAGTLRLRVKL